MADFIRYPRSPGEAAEELAQWERYNGAAGLDPEEKGWEHPLASPLGIAPRSSGRERAVEAGVPADEAQAQAVDDYMLPLRAGRKLQVFRCKECGVQIAHEADLCRRANAARGWFMATFKRTMNLVVVEGRSVCCLRCGVFLFGFDETDARLLTLPLYWHGERVFDKTPVRATIVLKDAPTIVAWVDRCEYHALFLSFLEDKISAMCPDYDVEVTFLVYVHAGSPYKWGPDVSGYGAGYHERCSREHARCEPDLETVLNRFKELGIERFSFVFHTELAQTLDALPAQDFALLVNKGPTYFLAWGDYPAENREELMLRLWMLCGGNFLFADWFFPKGCKSSGEPGELDLHVKEPDHWESGNGVENWQITQGALMRDGHYLGFWKKGGPRGGEVFPVNFPDSALKMIESAMQSRHLYPQWLFLRDYPERTFECLRRRNHPDQANVVPYAAFAVDKIVPNYRPDPPNEVANCKSECSIL